MQSNILHGSGSGVELRDIKPQASLTGGVYASGLWHFLEVAGSLIRAFHYTSQLKSGFILSWRVSELELLRCFKSQRPC